MTVRAEVTSRYARAHVQASKTDQGRVLDAVVGVTGWSRDTARRRLLAAAAHPPGSRQGSKNASEILREGLRLLSSHERNTATATMSICRSLGVLCRK